MSGSAIKENFKRDMTPSKSGSIRNNLKRDFNRDFKPNPFRSNTADPAPEIEAIYQSLYQNGFPTQWGVMSGPMMPLQNISGWQLNPMQIDALFAGGNGMGGQQGLPVPGSYLARLAALQQGRQNGS